jgi:hypothetical protein
MTTGRIANLKIDGDLVGLCTDELLKQCHQQIDAGRHLRLDLAGAVRVDRASVEKLKDLARNGMELINTWGGSSMYLLDDATIEGRKEA